MGAMFRLMEIPEGRWADALYYVLMSCRGHGVGLADSFGLNIDIAESELARGIDLSPFCDDFMDFYCLASDVVEAEARKPEDPDPQAAIPTGRPVADRFPAPDRRPGDGDRDRRAVDRRWRPAERLRGRRGGYG